MKVKLRLNPYFLMHLNFPDTLATFVFIAQDQN